MRRTFLLVAVTITAAVAALTAYFAWPSKSPAEPPRPIEQKQAVAAPSETTTQLPIGQVVLFSSGVGYFQREGTIDGDARVDLSFPTQDINDLIKSMVLRDLNGGHVSAVSYDSNAPVEKTLQSFAVNLSANPTFGQVLNQARGEKVEVVLQQANAAQPGTMTGSIMGVEAQQQPAGKEGTVNVEQLNLWCADGMRGVKLADVQRVRFLNPVMDNEVRKALETLTLSHDTQKKAVSLNFVGEGKREVRVGYVIENPIWKTSYRLVLGKEKDDKPFLQGWAVVENATDEDWKDVRMALVSGRPISFQMDLYTPLYVPRPTVVPELFASLRPATYNGDLKTSRGEVAAYDKIKRDKEDFFLTEINETAKTGPAADSEHPLGVDPETERANKGRGLGMYPARVKSEKERDIERKLSAPVSMSFSDVPLRQVVDELRATQGINIYVDQQALDAEKVSLEHPISIKLDQVSLKSALNLILKSVHLTYVIKDEVLQITTESQAKGMLQRGAYQLDELLNERMGLGDSGVSTMATATKLGDSFQYAIDKPVTLPRQKSALLPIVNKDVQGQRCSIYNERTQAKFPLLGLKFKNTSGLHLMQGPITVFEGSNYAGDARILDVEPNEERLLSYAVDLGTEVNAVPSGDNGRLTMVKVNKGILYSTTKLRETKTYTIVNRNDAERLVLIEHPVRNDFHLTDDTAKPAETASDVYRFEVKVPAGKTATQIVTEERIIDEQVQLTNSNYDQIRFFVNATVVSPKVQDGLRQALDLRRGLNITRREVEDLQQEVRRITDDQVRLRANLKEMPPTAAAYKRYLDKFDQQETQIEKYQSDIKTMQGTAHQQQKEFEDFLGNFSAD